MHDLVPSAISMGYAMKSDSNGFCKGSKWLLQTPETSICWSALGAQGEEPLSPSPIPKAYLLPQAEAFHG